MLVLLFLFVPIALIVLYAFNRSNIESWPIPSFTLHWFTVAWHDPQVRARSCCRSRSAWSPR